MYGLLDNLWELCLGVGVGVGIARSTLDGNDIGRGKKKGKRREEKGNRREEKIK